MIAFGKDPLTQLAFSVYENPGVFAVLLGSGLSQSAEIPTGWEISLDLIRRVALAQGVGDQSDWATWYREETGQEPSYSNLLKELAPSPDERRSILHSYIEPTDQDREEGKKVPTPAHRAVAEMVRAGFVRVIVTTNFDRLMENALHERGVEPTVATSVDTLKGAEPLTHSACYILKLHGDYKDARILNTDEELSGYPSEYEMLLDRIFDEYGLIVCGWSGEWDHALRAALLRAPNRRYPVHWSSRGKPGSCAGEIIAHRGARLVDITDADSFFTGLWQRVQTLEHTHRQNPLGVDLLVNSTKRYLAKPEYRIPLDDLFKQETERLIEKIDSSEFTAKGGLNQSEFRNRVALYEAATEPLACMAGVLGRWGDDNELSLVVEILRAISAHADKVDSGSVVWQRIRTYPAELIFTAYGLGLVRSERWRTLHRLLSASISRKYHDSQRTVDLLFLRAWEGSGDDYWRHVSGPEKRETPISVHLGTLFKEWSNTFVSVTADFEQLFGQFEILASLVHVESSDITALDNALAMQGDLWVPMRVGLSGWHSSVRERILSEILSRDLKPALLQAGFGGRSADFLNKSIENYRRIANWLDLRP